MRILLTLSSLAAAGLIAVAVRGLADNPEALVTIDKVTPGQETTSPAPAVQVVTLVEARDDASAQKDRPDRVNSPQPGAVASLRQAMQSGDPRTPPLPKERKERDQPTPEELANPKLYLAYEARQKQQVYASFVAAASGKISILEKMITRGAGGGVSPEQLAKARTKLDRLKQQRELLLQQHPELQKEKTEDQ